MAYKYTIRAVFEQIVEIAQNIEDFSFSIDELWEWTLFDGSNEYLNNALETHENSGVVTNGRKDALSDGQTIEGRYLLFDLEGMVHQPLWGWQL
jgi:hypothetical protein